jgi:hypothetical protein
VGAEWWVGKVSELDRQGYLAFEAIAEWVGMVAYIYRRVDEEGVD